MEKNVKLLSKKLLVLPGETIKEALEEKNITKEDFVIKSGYSIKYINKIINGKKNISKRFANVLENILNIDASFWLNLQSNYNKEVSIIKKNNIY